MRTDYLRISVIDRCNLRCVYCHPLGGCEFLRREEILRLEEIERIARLLAKCGIRKIRLTGGEPLIRKNITYLIEKLAGIEEIEGYIKTLGFFHSKAKYLKNASLKIQNDFNGTVPETMDELITLPGVGRKTANIVLAHGFGHQEGIAVDTHVKRLSFLLGLTMEQDPVRIEGDLMALIPRDDWALFSDLLILHGRAVCVARKPACGKCRLNRVCPYVQNVSK